MLASAVLSVATGTLAGKPGFGSGCVVTGVVVDVDVDEGEGVVLAPGR